MSTMTDATMAEQLREWAGSLDRVGATDEMLLRGIIAGMRQVAADIAPKVRLRRRVAITRYWFEDEKFVEARKAENPIVGWQRQIAEEFDACGVNGTEGEGSSVIARWSSDVIIVTHDDGNMTATFTAALDFEYGDLGSSFTNDHDVIQHLFYDEGGVAGEFHMLDDGGEK